MQDCLLLTSQTAGFERFWRVEGLCKGGIWSLPLKFCSNASAFSQQTQYYMKIFRAVKINLVD